MAAELFQQGYAVSATSVRRMLSAMGYSLQANRKAREGRQRPDRDGQFRHIAERMTARKRRGEPAISVDTKKKGVLGNLKNPGKTYRPRRHPQPVKSNDFPDPELGKAVPYGVDDNRGYAAAVSVGISHDTAEFAVGAIRRWWVILGRTRYGSATWVLITADSGGSNGSRCRQWKLKLQRWADETGLIVEVCHYPLGSSKWNKIEHRLIYHITRNWRGTPLETPLETLEVAVESIGATTTEAGLEVHPGSTKVSTRKAAESADGNWPNATSNPTITTANGTMKSIPERDRYSVGYFGAVPYCRFQDTCFQSRLD